jgi:5-methylcytosine-specific restriction endonuclease McrA
VHHGFTAVIKAFHNVNHAEVPTRFFTDERKPGGGIALTDELLALKDDFQYRNLPGEVEARWRLVETAWSLNLSPNLLVARYDPSGEDLYVVSKDARRINVTSCRDALNGYQKGQCFYCRSTIDVGGKEENVCDVDHFFPHVLIYSGMPEGANIDGVWNLVLSCRRCNRGEGGKFARVPYVQPYLERLHERNTYLIDSHHPLRETLINQTGRTESERIAFLNRMDVFAISRLVHRWEPVEVDHTAF